MPVMAAVGLPHTFKGTAQFCTTFVAEDTVIDAYIGAELKDSSTVGPNGVYPKDGSVDPLRVNHSQVGAMIEFFIGDRKVGEHTYDGWATTNNFLLQVTEPRLTTASTVGGSVTTPGEGTSTHTCTELVDIVASPADGYQFDLWDGDTATVGVVDDESTAIMMNGDYSIIAIFSLSGGDITPPSLESTLPVDSAIDVPLNAAVSALFSEDIQEGADFGDITVNGIAITPSVASATLTIAHDWFAESTEYTVTIPAGAIEDLAGNPLVGGEEWSFTTGEAVVGDANGDGVINVLDITFVAWIILGWEEETPGADANQDGEVNVLDMTKIAEIILNP
jgi:hypothetical protein